MPFCNCFVKKISVSYPDFSYVGNQVFRTLLHASSTRKEVTDCHSITLLSGYVWGLVLRGTGAVLPRGLSYHSPESSCFSRARKLRTDTDLTLVQTDDGLADQKLQHRVFENRSVQSSPKVSRVTNLDEVQLLPYCHSTVEAFHIPQITSWSPLRITKKVFEALCSRLDVFMAFRDTIVCMGLREREMEVAPPRLKWQNLSSNTGHELYEGWELSYCLRYIEENHRGGDRPWSLRQFAVYNKVEPVSTFASWIFVSLPSDAHAKVEDFMSEAHASGLESSVILHLTLLEMAIAYWRPYLLYLTEQFHGHVWRSYLAHGNCTANCCQNLRIKFADPMEVSKLKLATDGTRLRLKALEDDVTDAVLAWRQLVIRSPR